MEIFRKISNHQRSNRKNIAISLKIGVDQTYRETCHISIPFGP